MIGSHVGGTDVGPTAAARVGAHVGTGTRLGVKVGGNAIGEAGSLELDGFAEADQLVAFNLQGCADVDCAGKSCIRAPLDGYVVGFFGSRRGATRQGQPAQLDAAQRSNVGASGAGGVGTGADVTPLPATGNLDFLIAVVVGTLENIIRDETSFGRMDVDVVFTEVGRHADVFVQKNRENCVGEARRPAVSGERESKVKRSAGNGFGWIDSDIVARASCAQGDVYEGRSAFNRATHRPNPESVRLPVAKSGDSNRRCGCTTGYNLPAASVLLALVFGDGVIRRAVPRQRDLPNPGSGPEASRRRSRLGGYSRSRAARGLFAGTEGVGISHSGLQISSDIA